MNLKKIGLLIGILIVLIIVIRIVITSEKQKWETEAELINLDQEKVVKLELLKEDGSFIFKKQKTTWYIESPVKTRADKEAVEDILDDFCALKFEREVEKEAKDLKKYGLEIPEIQLKLYENESETPVHIIQMGIKNPFDSSSYTKLANQNKIVLTTSYKRDHLEKDLFDFRYKRFINFESLEVREFDFKFQGKIYVFRKKKNQWFLEHPVFSLAQESRVEDIISSTTQLEAKSFWGKSDSEQLKKFGFETPLIELNLKLKTGEKKLKVVKLKNQFLAYTPGFEDLCEIDESYIEHFSKKLSEFREHKIARFYSFDVQEINYRDKALHFIIRKNAQGTWTWIKPVLDEKIDEDKVNDLLSAIENLEADSFIDKPSGKEKFLYFLEIKVKDENTQKKVEIFKISLTGIRESFVTAQNIELPYLFKVLPEIINKLPENLETFFQKDKEKSSP